MNESSLISYPARPVNGGRLEDAPPKVGPWIAQPKIKDWRAIVHAPTKRIWNRHGEPMSIEKDLEAALSILHCMPFEWLDVGVLDRQNQLLRGTIVVFDLIEPVSSYQVRRHVLAKHFEELPQLATDFLTFPHWKKRRIHLIPDTNSYVTNPGHDWAQALYETFKEQNAKLGGSSTDATDTKNFYEGIVCKRTDKPYPVQLQSPTKETPWMIKHRFDQ